jgi:serine phosphatase RsbU (regulator of sigma subunit)
MTIQPERLRLDLRRVLEAVEASPPVGAADAWGAELAAVLGARDVRFLIADFSGRSLIRLGHDGTRATAEAISLEGSPHGRALITQEVVVTADGDGACLYAPVTSRGEAVGVLEVTLPAPPDDGALADVALAGHMLAFVVIANRRYTDLYEWGQRTVPLSLAAEIQRRLLPGAYTCEAGQCTIAGWLEPAGDVGGDTFDFALEHDTLHLSLTDAMGHTVPASLLATILVGALRNARRGGATLAEQARRAHDELVAETQPGQFVTGQIARVDLATGRATIVNAGHPLPLRLRGREVTEVDLHADLPFGTLPAAAYRVQELPLEPGDRLVFLTDGMLGNGSAGMELAPAIAETAGLSAREAVQDLARKVLDDRGGYLRDDATVLVLDWHGGPPRDRDTAAGANR